MKQTVLKQPNKPPAVTVYFDERGIELCGRIVEMTREKVTIKMPFTGNIYNRRIDQIRSFPRRK